VLDGGIATGALYQQHVSADARRHAAELVQDFGLLHRTNLTS